MPFTVFQAGNTLRTVNTDGGLSAALTLPNGVSLNVNAQPRFARFQRYVVMVNTPTRPLTIDSSGVVRLLTPAPPSTAVTLANGSAGSLTGVYKALQTYKLLDSLGNVISESDFGPVMASGFSVNNRMLRATFPINSDTVSATQLYRTTTGPGGVYFPWKLVSGNSSTSAEDAVPDTGLGIVAAPELGTAPDLTLVAEFGGRLYGVERSQPDYLRYTTAGTMYGWNAQNTVLIPRVGSDSAGITALIPRRAALGVARHNTTVQVTGTVRANITPLIVNGGEQVGCVSQESVRVHNDVAYWLGRDGVYSWDSGGVRCITDGIISGWFNTDTYFNRSMFWRAFAEIDPGKNTYNLFLASAGVSVHDRWISLDIPTGRWFGPHLTDAFSPSCALWVAGRNQLPFFMVGSREGYISQTTETRADWGLYPINARASVRTETMGEPEQEKYFGELSVHVKPQTGGTLTITPELGSVDETAPTAAMTAPLTQGKTRVGRIGTGNAMVMDFQNAELNVDAAIYGYEVNPVNPIGQR